MKMPTNINTQLLVYDDTKRIEAVGDAFPKKDKSMATSNKLPSHAG
jgi:hypothetical protein